MKILTPTGFQEYYKIQKKTAQCSNIVFKDKSNIKCSTDHRFDNDGVEIVANKLKIGDKLNGKVITEITPIGEQTVYTPVMVQNGNKYIANGLINYNCSFEGSSPTLVDGEILKTFLPSDPCTIKYNYAMNVYECV